jgi:RNA polymerase sigma-70 factor (ECF subfamily)
MTLAVLSLASDRELVATAVSGVERSFEELVRRYQRPISAYVYRMVGNYESALDQPLSTGVQILDLDLQDRA